MIDRCAKKIRASAKKKNSTPDLGSSCSTTDEWPEGLRISDMDFGPDFKQFDQNNDRWDCDYGFSFISTKHTP